MSHLKSKKNFKNMTLSIKCRFCRKLTVDTVCLGVTFSEASTTPPTYPPAEKVNN